MRWEPLDGHYKDYRDDTWIAYLDNGDEYARVKRGVGALAGSYRAAFTDGRVCYRRSHKRAMTYVEFAAHVAEMDMEQAS